MITAIDAVTTASMLSCTATKWQISTYLLGVALFSISFLVFLNSSVSFVVTDLIGQKKGVGNAVGTLGFADELVALVACPVWGLLSDRLGVRTICVTGYSIIGLSLFVFVQSKNVFPQLLLARLFFSVGGAATSTMVTAILPTMTAKSRQITDTEVTKGHARDSNQPDGSIPDETTSHDVPSEDVSSNATERDSMRPPRASSNSQIAGLVGMFTGVGALVALGLFLPLPARLRSVAGSAGEAVIISFYIVGTIAFLVAGFCFLGLRGLAGEENRGFRHLFKSASATSSNLPETPSTVVSYLGLASQAILLGFSDIAIGLGYLGGFVARASSVAISLFIPLYVNAYFISTGLCKEDPSTAPSDIKDQCERAYKLAAALTGVSQLSALLFAPLFGYMDGRYRRYNLTLIVPALAGVIGYLILAKTKDPDLKSASGGPGIFGVMVLLGFSQIGAIVCSLSSLGRGISGNDDSMDDEGSSSTKPLSNSSRGVEDASIADERASLLPSQLLRLKPKDTSRTHLKGSIAGIYSLAGGVGILLLTKLGGSLFDSVSHGAPFYLLAGFNGVLLLVGLVCGIASEIQNRRHTIAM